ncbi:TetR/AcrR family transcriptional regulator [Phytoactinopolyspora endophytica]|uniref:TetR/AcrR family transcriptional regulator n=1 Tax=Phytoactinopolyspora endophytica TaxID=1642495 RepID=UPI00101DFB74|nr:TetR/AcrR family transcriptional regulator [Phytoactinopolyspora endophytica]
MPKLWNQTIETHRREVRDAILETTASLVAERGLASVTMSRIAEQAGIGRATLYKYFRDVDAILRAWHERQVAAHLEHLAVVRDSHAGDPGDRLAVVLESYALIHRRRAQHHGSGPRGAELAVYLHRDEHVASARQQLHEMVRDLLAEAAEAGDLRSDIAADELADYCLHALGAAGGLNSDAAVQRLVTVVLAGLQPTR